MISTVGFLGFGEAAQAFTGAQAWCAPTCAFDLKTDSEAQYAAKRDDYRGHGVDGLDTAAELGAKAALVLSVVTADQSVAAARAITDSITADTLFLDMNSVAPGRKAEASALIEAAGGRYVDVAVMAPVYPAQLSVPLLVSGVHAGAAERALRELGFDNVRKAGERIGQASTIKMVRSVLIKGIEALTAECLLAAEAADVTDDVLASLGPDWPERADYNLERMLVHGLRRAAEMEEVCTTLEELGVPPLLSRGTVQRQRALGERGLSTPPQTLSAKLTALTSVAEAHAQ